MGGFTVLAVFVGAGLGAVVRFALNTRFNPVIPALPLGTLIANLVGGYLVGLVAGLLALKAPLPPELRPLLITGFLGGLTTFSAFSLELAEGLQAGRFGVAATHVLVHVVGSLLLTFLGLQTARWIAAA